MRPAASTVAHRLLELVDLQDWDAMSGLFSLDARYDRPGYEPMRGRPAILGFYINTRDVAMGSHIIDGVIETASEAACWGRFNGRRKNGEEVSVIFADWYEVERGLITRRRTFFFSPVV